MTGLELRRAAGARAEDRRWLVGVDIGGTKVAVGLVPVAGGEVRGIRRWPTDPLRGPEAVVADIAEMVREAVDEVAASGERPELAGTGVGCPGPIDRTTGRIVESPNLRWIDVPLRDLIAERLSGPVHLDNDANCATWGEWWRGAGRGARSMIGVTVGTGVGGGCIIDGRLVHGVSDGAGEIGHTTVHVSGRRCACGNEGCLEAYASGPAIAARAREGIERGASSRLAEMVGHDLAEISAETVFEGAVAGDPFALEVLGEAARFLGVGIANVINLLNPSVVVIMGGVTRAGDHLFTPVRQEVRRRAFRGLVDACAVVPAQLGQSAGLVGAAGLAAEAAGLLADAPGRE